MTVRLKRFYFARIYMYCMSDNIILLCPNVRIIAIHEDISIFREVDIAECTRRQ